MQLLNLSPIQAAQRGERCIKSAGIASAERCTEALNHFRAAAMVELREQLSSRSSTKQPIVRLNDVESELIQQCLREHQFSAARASKYLVCRSQRFAY